MPGQHKSISYQALEGALQEVPEEQAVIEKAMRLRKTGLVRADRHSPRMRRRRRLPEDRSAMAPDYDFETR